VFAVEYLRHQPAGTRAGGALHLAEIDEGGARRQIARIGEDSRIANANGSFAGHPGSQFGIGQNDARSGAHAARFDGVEFLLRGRVVVVGGRAQNGGDQQDRNGPK
jgi:hypothetical protein